MKNNVDCISHAVCGMAIDVDAKAIAICSISGITGGMINGTSGNTNLIKIATI